MFISPSPEFFFCRLLNQCEEVGGYQVKVSLGHSDSRVPHGFPHQVDGVPILEPGGDPPMAEVVLV